MNMANTSVHVLSLFLHGHSLRIEEENTENG